MNILYVSRAKGVPWAGPTYSIPSQIDAQRIYDNILWYNIIDRQEEYAKDWFEKTGWANLDYYKDLTDYPNQTISELPAPFSKPDLIIVEQFYGFAGCDIIKEIIDYGVPYIIVPRGEMTKDAQHSKRVKKIIGNTLRFKRFARKALAIQFLTESEYFNTRKTWNNNHIIIPNGTEHRPKPNRVFSDNGIKCVSIGRIAPYHKGLDLLLEACVCIKEQLVANNVTFSIYGPDREGKTEKLNLYILKNGLKDIVTIHGGIYSSEKEKVLKTADVFVITSRFEGHPTALLDAISCGLPALVTTGSNMREQIENSSAGWSSDNSSTGIAKAIIKMIEDKNQFQEKSNNAYTLAQKYEWDSIAKDAHNKYCQLLGRERDLI